MGVKLKYEAAQTGIRSCGASEKDLVRFLALLFCAGGVRLLGLGLGLRLGRLRLGGLLGRIIRREHRGGAEHQGQAEEHSCNLLHVILLKFGLVCLRTNTILPTAHESMVKMTLKMIHL